MAAGLIDWELRGLSIKPAVISPIARACWSRMRS